MNKPTDHTRSPESDSSNQRLDHEDRPLTICCDSNNWEGYCSKAGRMEARERQIFKSILDEDEVSGLLGACQNSDNPDLYLAVLMRLTVGINDNQICTLKWSDIDLKNRFVTLNNARTNIRREFYLCERTLQIIKKKKRRAHIHSQNSLVFQSPGGGQTRQCFVLKKALDEELKRKGISDFNWGNIRSKAAQIHSKKYSLSYERLPITIAKFQHTSV